MDQQIAGPLDNDSMDDLRHGMRDKSKNISLQYMVFV